MATTTVTRSASAWTPERVRFAGIAAIVGGVLYALSFLESNVPAFSEGGSLYALVFAAAVAAYLLVLVGLAGFHARYGGQYGRVGAALAYLMGLGLAVMVVGSALNFFAPNLVDPAQADATLGGTIWGLAMFATLILATLYGVVLWRADVSRLGAGLLSVSLVLLLVGLVVFDALSGVVGVNAGWLAFGGPFGAAWVVLGNQLRTSDVATATDAALPA